MKSTREYQTPHTASIQRWEEGVRFLKLKQYVTEIVGRGVLPLSECVVKMMGLSFEDDEPPS